MLQLRRFRCRLVLTCALLSAALLPAVSGAQSPEARRQEAVRRLARGEDVRVLLEELSQEAASGPRNATPPLPGDAAELKTAMRGLQTQSVRKRAAEDLKSVLAAYDSLRAADLLVKERFRSVRERIAKAGLSAEAEARRAEAEAAYLESVARVLGPLAGPIEKARPHLKEGKPVPPGLAAEISRALEQAAPILAEASAAAPAPILRASLLPYRSAGLAPRAPVASPTVVPAYLDPLAAAPVPADREAGADAPFEPEILAKAEALGHDYTRIFDFVRNEIRTEHYAGAMKGALGTLRQRSGNDVDQASLLVALLRASGAGARYVHGVIELPVETLAESLGVPAASVTAALARAGVAHAPVVRGGRLAAVQVEHTWVSAWVPYTNYRGAVVDLSGQSWVPLAPAIKGMTSVRPTGVLRRMGFGVGAAIDGQLAAPQPEDPLSTIRRQVQDWLAEEAPSETYAGQLGSVSIRAESLGLLPSSLPVTVVAVTGEAAALAPSRVQSVRIVARAGVSETDPVLLDLALPVAQVASERLTLSYIPATVDDHRTVNAFGGLQLTPAYLVRLRPQVRLGGRVVGIAEEAVDMAAEHLVQVVVTTPSGSETASRTAVAGSYYALGISAQRVLRQAEPEEPEASDDEFLAARLLARIALGYAERWDRGEDELAGLLDVAVVRPLPAVAIAGNAVEVETIFNLPHTVRWEGVTLDAALRVAEPLTRGTDAAAPRDWLRLSALQGSALEHRVFEEEFLVDSISADKGLGVARRANIEVVRLNASNADAILPTLTHPSEVIDDIRDWVQRGMTVDVPRTVIVRTAWQGSVWRVEDPGTGAAGYFIAGGLAGGATAEDPDNWVLDFLANALEAPNNEEPNSDPLSGTEIVKVLASDNQEGEVDEILPVKLSVQVRDESGRPVEGAEVHFEVGRGGGLLRGENGEAPTATALTDSAGIASVAFRLGERTDADPIYARRNPGDEFPTQALANLVDAWADSRQGTLVIDQPFEAIAYPGEPTALRRTDGEAPPGSGIAGAWSDAIFVVTEDRFGNPVSNVEVTFAVAPLEYLELGCPNKPDHPAQNAVVFDNTLDASGQMVGCPVRQPVLGDCGGPTLTRRTSPHGTSAGVILGSSFIARYRVDVTAEQLAPLPYTYGQTFLQIGDGECQPLDIFRIVSTLTVNEQGDVITAVRAGRTLQQPVEVRLYSWRPEYKVVTNDQGKFDLQFLTSGRWEATTANNVVYTVSNGGQATPPLQTPELTYQTTVTTGPAPGANEVKATAYGFHYHAFHADENTGEVTESAKVWNLPIDDKVTDVWGVEPRITGVVPSPMVLNTKGRTAVETLLRYEVDPAEYTSRLTEVDLFEAGEPYGTALGSARSGAGSSSIQRGFAVDVEKIYEAELVLNRGGVMEILSDRFRLPVREQIFANADTSAFVSQDVDLLNQRFCPSADKFEFEITQRARVTLTVRKIEALETDSSPILGPTTTLMPERLLERGRHGILITPAGVAPAEAELPPGTYHFELRGVSDVDGSVETVTGTMVSEYHTRDSLAVGHAMVQGVDLWDGHLSVGREDFKIPGRGLPLSFQRTYSSNGGGEPGPLGPGWSHNWDSRVVITPCGDAIVIGGEGSGMRFVDDGAGGLKPLKGYHGSLVADDDTFSFDFYSKDGTRYHYVHGAGTEFLLSWVADPDGNTTRLDYDLSNPHEPLLKAVRDSAGRTLSFTYEVRQFALWGGYVLTRVEGPDGMALTFSYDIHGNLARSAREEDAQVETYAYAMPPDYGLELRHKLLSTRNELNGATTAYTYDTGAIGLQGDISVSSYFVTSVTEPEDGVTRFDYDEASLETRAANELEISVTDPRDKVTTYRLNRYGSPLEITDPLENKTTMTWAADDIVMTSRTDGNGVETTYTYDEHGNQLSESVEVTDVDGQGHTYTIENEYWPPATFDPPYIKSRVKTRTDRNGSVISYAYDSKGHLTEERITVLDGQAHVTYITSHSYLPNGDRSSITDPRGNTTRLSYDVYGNLAEVRDARGGVTTTTFDERSQPIEQKDALDRVTTFAYDTLGRLTTKNLPRIGGEGSNPVETTLYQDSENRVTRTDAEGRSARTTSDRQGRVVEVVDSEGAVKVLEYDLAGNKTLESNWHDAETQRADTLFSYDDAARLTRREEPLGRLTDYAYDAVGNVTKETLSAADGSMEPRVTDALYDELNRRIKEDRALGSGVVTTRIKYDGNGNKISIQDPLGRVTAFTYDQLNRLVEKTEPEWKTGSNKVTRYRYDGNGNLVQETAVNEPANQVRHAEYDEVNRPIKKVDALGKETLFEYDAIGNLTRQIDPRLNTVAHEYDARNRRTRTTIRLDRITTPSRSVVTEYGYDRVGNLTVERWPNDNVVQHRYDGLNRLLATEDSLGPVVSYAYDANGNRVRETDANDHVTVRHFDALNRLTQEDLLEDRTVEYTYDAASNRIAQKDPRGFTTTFEYDRLNRLVKTTDPEPFSYTVEVGYDAVGNKTSEKNRRGHVTTLEYDALNRLIKTTAPAPLSYTMAYAYDAVGNKVSEIDWRGIQTLYRFDLENRISAVEKAGLVVQQLQYDENGNKRFETDANGNVTGWEYEERNLVTAENRPLAAITKHRYDDMGNRVATTDPEGRITTYGYDARRRMTSEKNHAAEETLYSYDGKGNRTALKRPEQATAWTYGYDEADRLVEVTDPLSHATTYSYDKNDNRTGQTDAEQRPTTFEYDELNRTKAKVYPGGAREEYKYDGNGNRIEIKDAKSQTITIGYDQLNRETSRSYPLPSPATGDDIRSITTTYDPNNNPLTITEIYDGPTGTAVTTYTYDVFDRIESVTDRFGEKLVYAYDANGNRATLTDPDGKVTRYTFDALNRTTSVTVVSAGVTNYEYFRDSRLKRVTYPNATVSTTTYDAAGRTATMDNRLSLSSPQPLSAFVYTYDKNGNRTRQVETRGAVVETTDYDYDDADRLLEVTYPDKKVTYTHDRVGNRLTEKTVAGGTIVSNKSFIYDHRDRLQSVADAADPSLNTTFAYDLNGNQTGRVRGGVTTDLVYDVRNQLVSVVEGGTPQGVFGYNSLGLRVTKEAGGQLLRYVYDEDSVLLQTDPQGNTVAKYDYGPDRLLSLSHAIQGRQFYLFDSLGSVTDLTGLDGTLKASYQYDAWGNLRAQTGASFNVFGFTGHERDDETGLYYFKARFYDPELGLFLSEDPFAGEVNTPPSLHRYLYAYVNPTAFMDPTGEATVEVLGKKFEVRDELVKDFTAYLAFKIGQFKEISEDVNEINEAAKSPIPPFVQRLLDELLDSIANSKRAFEAAGQGPEAIRKEQQRLLQHYIDKLREEVRVLPGVATLDKTGKAVILKEEGRDFAANMQAGQASIQLLEDALFFLSLRGGVRGPKTGGPKGLTEPVPVKPPVPEPAVRPGEAMFRQLPPEGAAGDSVGLRLREGVGKETPSTTKLRDPKTGRFAADPANPPSPYNFTDAQRRAAWKRLAQDPNSPLTPAQRAEIQKRGWRGPQRVNPETGLVETMELSHEPIPVRDGGTEVVPRWPDEHAAVDPHRRLKKSGKS